MKNIAAIIVCFGLFVGSVFAQVDMASLPAKNTENTSSERQELISRGKLLYNRRCTACHSLDQNRIGPRHRDVYGRAAGSVSGFRYSKTLQELDIVWTEETLDPWLASPTTFAPGTRMGFRLKKPEERMAIIAYLKSLVTPNITSEAGSD